MIWIIFWALAVVFVSLAAGLVASTAEQRFNKHRLRNDYTAVSRARREIARERDSYRSPDSKGIPKETTPQDPFSRDFSGQHDLREGG